MSYCFRVFERGDSKGACNALRFATEEEAAAYGRDLLWRWTLPERGEVQPTDDPVNAKFNMDAGLVFPLQED